MSHSRLRLCGLFALTFDDILLVPRHSTVLPAQVDVEHEAHQEHPPERAAA